ncbi:hypothetical protein [Amycolatopsis thermoflava]
MVAEHLARNPTAAVTPSTIAQALKRSSGAVGNALAMLAARGQAEQVATNPVTYRATGKTADAAKTVTITPRTTTTTVSTPAPAALVTTPVRCPNGQMYHPRKLSGLSDVTALRRLRAAGVSALMYGPPGTGKTSVVEAAFDDLITCRATATPSPTTSWAPTPKPRTGATNSPTARW